MNKTLVLLVFVVVFELKAQITDSVVVDGTKIAVELLEEITLKPLHLNSSEKIKFNRVQRKVFKVYKYALAANKQLLELEDDLKYAEGKREKRKIGKLHDKWIQENFTDQIKKLTRSEGRILIKLIHRETGMSAYDLVRSYRNGVTAFLWQKLAKYFDGDLKTTYQPDFIKEDEWIEHVLWERNRNQLNLIPTQ